MASVSVSMGEAEPPSLVLKSDAPSSSKKGVRGRVWIAGVAVLATVAAMLGVVSLLHATGHMHVDFGSAHVADMQRAAALYEAGAMTTAAATSTPQASCEPQQPPPPTGNFDETAPVSVTIVDYTNPAQPTPRGTFQFDSPQPDMVFKHKWLDESIGNISIVHSTGSAVWGEFEFGATLFAMSRAHNAENPNRPVYQVLVGAKPYGRWATYPARRTWNITTDVTHPPAFKVELRGAAGQLLGTIQMSDGLPINSPLLSQVRGDETPLRPMWHIGQQLKWQSALTKPNANMYKWMSGFTIDSIRPTQAKQPFSTNGAVGVFGFGANMGGQVNSFQHWPAMPKWPMGDHRAHSIWNKTFPPTNDIYAPIDGYTYGGRWNSATGWGYEPGAYGGHDQMTGPGGARIDRGTIATPYAIYLANSTWRRPMADEPIRELVEHWGDNYFNLGGYWVRNLSTWQSLPMDEVHCVRWAFSKAYYGSQLNEIPDRDAKAWDYNVELRVAGQGSYNKDYNESLAYYYDRDGLAFWNGWGVDAHHAYQFPGYHTLMFSSPAHVFAAKQAYTWQVMARLGSKKIGKAGDFLYRTHAFRWHHLVMQWILANDHPSFGISDAIIEGQFHADLAQIVDEHKRDALVPKKLEDVAMQRLGTYTFDLEWRNLGNATNPIKQWRLFGSQSSLGYYSTYTYALMKQSGLWERLRYNNKSAEGLDFILSRLDAYAFGKVVHAKGRPAWQTPLLHDWTPENVTYSEQHIPRSWEEWAQKFPGSGPNETITQLADGSFKPNNNEYAASHAEVAYACMRVDYFPEVPHPLMQQACNDAKAAYDAVEQKLPAIKDPIHRRNADWTYRWPHLGFLKPPVSAPYKSGPQTANATLSCSAFFPAGSSGGSSGGGSGPTPPPPPFEWPPVPAEELAPAYVGRPSGSNFDDTAPVSVTIVDYTNPALPTPRGSFQFDSPQPDLKFEHQWLDESIGDVSIVHSSGSAVWGQFEFGATLFAMSRNLNAADPTKPVYQVLVGAKPYGRWSTYPAARTFNKSSDVTHPPPFKVELRGAAGQLLGTIQMSDGLPINSPLLNQTRGGVTEPLRPKWHIGQVLKWQNGITRRNANMYKWLGGFTSDSLRASQAKAPAATSASQAVGEFGAKMKDVLTGVGHYFAMPKWPLGQPTSIWDATDTINKDPMLTLTAWEWVKRGYSLFGYGYEPGQPGGHEHFTAPTGARADRSPIATPYAAYLTDPSFRREKDGASARELAEAWGDNYFNHGGYWLRDLNRWQSLPESQIHSGRWSFLKAYYQNTLNAIPTNDASALDYNVALNVVAEGGSDRDRADALSKYYGRDELLFWNAWAPDVNFAAMTPGWHTLLFSSAAHVFAAKQAYAWQTMAQLGVAALSKTDFLGSAHAFRWQHLIMQWVLRNPHPTMGIDGAAIEQRLHADLALIVDQFKAGHDNPTTMDDFALRQLGSYLTKTAASQFSWGTGQWQYALQLQQSAFGYYFTYTLALMKTSGLWDRLRTVPKSAAGLDFVIEKLDQFAFGKIVYGLERMGWANIMITPWQLKNAFTTADIPTSWQDWAVRNPASGWPEDMVRLNGTFKAGKNEHMASHAEAAYAFMRRDYFPELPHPLLNQACAAFQIAYDAVAQSTVGLAAYAARQADWVWRWPSVGFLKPPVTSA